jgi:hypothetical protein
VRYYVLELTDNHKDIRKSFFNRRVLPRIARPGQVPRAENFDYVYPQGTYQSNDYAFRAARKQGSRQDPQWQETLRDGTWYDAFARMNQSAATVAGALQGPIGADGRRQPTALFYFFGHGGPTVNLDVYPLLVCYDGMAYSYVAQTRKLRDKLVNLGVDPASIQVLDDLPDGALNSMLLAVLEGCFTASNADPTEGRPTDGIVQRGARAGLGFTECIVGDITDNQRNWAQRWSQWFWQYACQGHPTLGEIGYRRSCLEAILTVGSEVGNLIQSGLESKRFV